MPHSTNATVVKFGGSLLGSHELGDLLAVASAHGAVIVPGGGRFADIVRDEQERLGFSDAAAHGMAIRAMDQTAGVLADIAPTMSLCTTREDFERHTGAIWSPSPMAFEANVPSSWDVTSDSLALWLAIELRAPRLILLKSCPAPTGAHQNWADSGFVDRHFAVIAKKFGGEIDCVGPASPAALEAALAAPRRVAA